MILVIISTSSSAKFEGLKDDHWHQVCVSYTSGHVKFYKDGTLIHSRDDCKSITIRNGEYMAIANSGREGKDIVLITGYVLWDRILTDEEILESSKMCQAANGKPVITWNDFYKSVETNAANYLIRPSECRATM